MWFATLPLFSAVMVSSASSGLSSTSRISISSNSCIVVAPRKREVEGRPLADAAFGPDAAAVTRNDTVNQRESHARSGKLRSVVQTLEDPEELGCVFRIEPRAVVLNVVGVLALPDVPADDDERLRFFRR